MAGRGPFDLRRPQRCGLDLSSSPDPLFPFPLPLAATPKLVLTRCLNRGTGDVLYYMTTAFYRRNVSAGVVVLCGKRSESVDVAAA